MDLVFTALSHKTRRRILDLVHDRPGLSVGALAAEFDVSRISVMQHLNVLSDAGLITSEREGRTRHLYLNALPLQTIHARWLDTYSSAWADRALGIKFAAEALARQLKDQEE